MANNTIAVTWENDEGEEIVVNLPAKHEVCSRCEGHGSHLNPSIGEHAYTPEEFCESFDEEEREEYFRRGGRYDVTCHACNGKNVVLVIDEKRIKQNGLAHQREALHIWHEQQREERLFQRECEAERRFGC